MVNHRNPQRLTTSTSSLLDFDCSPAPSISLSGLYQYSSGGNKKAVAEGSVSEINQLTLNSGTFPKRAQPNMVPVSYFN